MVGITTPGRCPAKLGVFNVCTIIDIHLPRQKLKNKWVDADDYKYVKASSSIPSGTTPKTRQQGEEKETDKAKVQHMREVQYEPVDKKYVAKKESPIFISNFYMDKKSCSMGTTQLFDVVVNPWILPSRYTEKQFEPHPN